MNAEEFRKYCIAKKGVTEELPFGPKTLVYKVMGKIFALTPLESDTFKVSLKCEPAKAIELRDEFAYIIGAFHLSETHWNSIDGKLCSSQKLRGLTSHSYNLMVWGLLKKLKIEFDNLPN